MEQNQKLEEGLERALKIIKDVNFPSLPLFLQQIQREMGKKDPSFQTITHYIQQDMALTAKILKTVNSITFRTRHHIETVSQALTLLGMENFYTTVLSEAIKTELDQKYLSEENFYVIWKHATTIAMACQFIAEKMQEYGEVGITVDGNCAYLAGLFHDCGIPVMAAKYDDYQEKAEEAFQKQEALVTMEDRIYHTDHSVVCYIIGKMWELPETVFKAIYYHHSTELDYYPLGEIRHIAIILKVAEAFCEDILQEINRPHPFTSLEITKSEAYELLLYEFGIDEDLANELYDDLSYLLLVS